MHCPLRPSAVVLSIGRFTYHADCDGDLETSVTVTHKPTFSCMGNEAQRSFPVEIACPPAQHGTNAKAPEQQNHENTKQPLIPPTPPIREATFGRRQELKDVI
jgi:hypothetical protein